MRRETDDGLTLTAETTGTDEGRRGEQTVKKVIPTTRHGSSVLLVASQLSGVFVAALEAALPGVVVVSGPVIVAATITTVAAIASITTVATVATIAAIASAAVATAVVPTILAATAAGPDGLHVAARLPGVAVAEASTARSVII